MPRLTFDEWMKRVDAHVSRICGLSYSDLPDIAYRDMYDDGASPKEAAQEALAEAGW